MQYPSHCSALNLKSSIVQMRFIKLNNNVALQLSTSWDGHCCFIAALPAMRNIQEDKQLHRTYSASSCKVTRVMG